jgi:hypothetical protein
METGSMAEPEWSLPYSRDELIARCEALTSTANARLEVIQWHSVAEQLPDSNTTVLVSTPANGEPVWLGFYENDVWLAIDGGEFESGAVLAWAHVPKGPA